MSYYGYTSQQFGETHDITTFEMTLPNPVDGFAAGIITSAIKINEDSAIINENSIRYTFLNRCKRIETIPYIGMRTDSIVYPYFENEMQTVDFYTSLWTLCGLICCGFALLTFLIALICLFRSGFSFTVVLKQGFRKTINVINKQKNNINRKKERRNL